MRLAKAKLTAVAEKAVEKPLAPGHLSKRMKAFWNLVFEHGELEPHKILILQRACEALDRIEQARRLLKKHGMLVEDRFHQLKANPATIIEATNRAQFVKLLSELHLWNLFQKCGL